MNVQTKEKQKEIKLEDLFTEIEKGFNEEQAKYLKVKIFSLTEASNNVCPYNYIDVKELSEDAASNRQKVRALITKYRSYAEQATSDNNMIDFYTKKQAALVNKELQEAIFMYRISNHTFMSAYKQYLNQFKVIHTARKQ